MPRKESSGNHSGKKTFNVITGDHIIIVSDFSGSLSVKTKVIGIKNSVHAIWVGEETPV